MDIVLIFTVNYKDIDKNIQNIAIRCYSEFVRLFNTDTK